MTASRVLFGLAVLLVAGAVVALLLPSHPAAEPPMAVDPLTADLGAVAPGSRPLTFMVANPADRPRRIIGLAEG